MSGFDKDGLYFVALGGADEIGMNMYVYAHNGKFIMVDAGYGFLNDDYPGIDLCFADASFFANYAQDFEGIFITHAHEDHFGAIAHVLPLLNCPIYATDFAVGLIKNRLQEYGLVNSAEIHSVNTNPFRILRLNLSPLFIRFPKLRRWLSRPAASPWFMPQIGVLMMEKPKTCKQIINVLRK